MSEDYKPIKWQREITDDMTAGRFRVPQFAELAKKYWPWCLDRITDLERQLAEALAAEKSKGRKR